MSFRSYIEALGNAKVGNVKVADIAADTFSGSDHTKVIECFHFDEWLASRA